MITFAFLLVFFFSIQFTVEIQMLFTILSKNRKLEIKHRIDLAGTCIVATLIGHCLIRMSLDSVAGDMTLS